MKAELAMDIEMLRRKLLWSILPTIDIEQWIKLTENQNKTLNDIAVIKKLNDLPNPVSVNVNAQCVAYQTGLMFNYS